MITIWKYDIPALNQPLEIPRGAKVLCVQAQDEIPRLWVLVDSMAQKEDRYFEVVGTGNPITRPLGTYIGTWQDAPFVWHLFETTGLR